MTRTASCQCRGFRVVVEAEPDTVAICHCQICQRRTGVPLTCNAYFPKSKVRGRAQNLYPRLSRGAQTAQPFLPDLRLNRRLDSICVQISLVSRLVASTTGIFRLPWRRSGRRRCALGQRSRRAFSIPVRSTGSERELTCDFAFPRAPATIAGCRNRRVRVAPEAQAVF
jgi:glutathione-dependent formaldehyde-activating enzyme